MLRALLERLKKSADRLKTETFALYLAARDPRTPWYAKLFAGLVVAYLLSPIDLIPDFIPIIGYLDDLILVPIGIAVAIKLIPKAVLAQCRARAMDATLSSLPANRVVAVVIVSIWLITLALTAIWIYRAIGLDGRR